MCVTSRAVSGESGTSGWICGCFFVGEGGDAGKEDLLATGGGGGGSVGATSDLIGGGESGVGGFSERFRGFGARGGLDLSLGRGSSPGVGLEGEEGGLGGGD